MLQQVEGVFVPAQVFIAGATHEQGVLVAGLQPAADQCVVQLRIQPFQPRNFAKRVMSCSELTQLGRRNAVAAVLDFQFQKIQLFVQVALHGAQGHLVLCGQFSGCNASPWLSRRSMSTKRAAYVDAVVFLDSADFFGCM